MRRKSRKRFLALFKRRMTRRLRRRQRKAVFRETRRNRFVRLRQCTSYVEERALRMLGGASLPEFGSELCRLAKWGKNHHLRNDGKRTLCGLAAVNKRPVHFGKLWCVQCTTIGRAIEEG